jgi:hypothetical protein
MYSGSREGALDRDGTGGRPRRQTLPRVMRHSAVESNRVDLRDLREQIFRRWASLWALLSAISNSAHLSGFYCGCGGLWSLLVALQRHWNQGFNGGHPLRAQRDSGTARISSLLDKMKDRRRSARCPR